MENKYQKAYLKLLKVFNNIQLGINTSNTLEITQQFNTIKELVYKTKTLPLEEIKQKWKEHGYEWKEDDYFISLKYSDKYAEAKIIIEKHPKKFWKEDGHFEILAVDFVEHQLLTKTFKALGWEV